MAEKISALHAIYVIDGVQQEFTPAQLLDAVTEAEGKHPYTGPAEMRAVDESLDPVFRGASLDPDAVDSYLQAVMEQEKRIPPAAADIYTRIRIASSLIDTLWRSGHFRLGDLRLDAT